MKYFTKEYTCEADCPEIQDLKHGLEYGDWYFYKGKSYLTTNEYNFFSNRHVFKTQMFWLPTSGQLDEEIVKIFAKWSEDGEDLGYNFGVSFANGNVSAYEAYSNNRDCYNSFLDDNPLIAKIKLLKELIKNEK